MGNPRTKTASSTPAQVARGLLAATAVLLARGAIGAAAAPIHDGSHDFDFLIGDWKAHVLRLPDRLVGSHAWIAYDGVSRHKKLLDSNANFEEFAVESPQRHLHIKAQTLRLYNPTTRQWSIYLVDLDQGTLGLPPMVGEFTGKRGEFYDQETYKGRAVLVQFSSGSISRPTPRTWSKPSRPTAQRLGRSIGFVN